MYLTEILTINEIKFLKDLAHKRKTQEHDGCADPVFWMIQDQEILSISPYGFSMQRRVIRCKKKN